MNIQSLMAFHTDKIVPVSLMVPKEKVLAMRRLGNIPPKLQTLLHRVQRRVLVQLVPDTVVLQKVQGLFPQTLTFLSVNFHLSLILGANLVIPKK